MLSFFSSNSNTLLFTSVLFGTVVTLLLTKLFKDKLPTDIGRAFAVNAEKAKGKPRGAGIIFVLTFVFTCLVFVNATLEYIIYYVLLSLAMLTGFLDDSSRTPWGDYKKGLLDLIISLLITLTHVFFGGSELTFALLGVTVVLPAWLYIILGTILVWASINVTNCTDGVDGLSSVLGLITLGFFYLFILKTADPASYSSVATGIATEKFIIVGNTSLRFAALIPVLMGCLGAYLCFNASPSILLMGDAGSRTLGVFFALAAMKSGSALIFLPFCLVFILDGGLGLIKVALLRFLKIKILKNTRTPLHDHFRKNKGWSDTQVVIRFALVQLIVCSLVYMML